MQFTEHVDLLSSVSRPAGEFAYDTYFTENLKWLLTLTEDQEVQLVKPDAALDASAELLSSTTSLTADAFSQHNVPLALACIKVWMFEEKIKFC